MLLCHCQHPAEGVVGVVFTALELAAHQGQLAGQRPQPHPGNAQTDGGQQHYDGADLPPLLDLLPEGGGLGQHVEQHAVGGIQRQGLTFLALIGSQFGQQAAGQTQYRAQPFTTRLQETGAPEQREAADPGQRLFAGRALGIEHLAAELGHPARFADLLQQGGGQQGEGGAIRHLLVLCQHLQRRQSIRELTLHRGFGQQLDRIARPLAGDGENLVHVTGGLLPLSVEFNQLLFIVGKLAGQLLAQALGRGQPGASTAQLIGDRGQILLGILLTSLLLRLPVVVGEGRVGAEGERDKKGEPFHD
ncbi:hypothetical protein D3C84_539780 [compost metagenome]